MKLSFIVPVRGHPESLLLCVEAVSAAVAPGDERIVVDDGMDGSARKIADDRGFQVVPSRERGVAAARNSGARAATGEVLFFVDSDVLVSRDGVECMREALDEGSAQAVIAALSDACPIATFASRYKNLWMRFTYLGCADDVSLFYTSAAAVLRETFLGAGGFDERYERPSIEDTEIGYRLRKGGSRIRILEGVKPIHLRRYSVGTLLATDFRRSCALARHVLRSPPGERFEKVRASSIPSGFQRGVPLAAFSGSLALVLLSVGHPGMSFLLAAALVGALAHLNRGFLRYLRENLGSWFALKSALFLPVEMIVSAGGGAWGTAGFVLGRKY